MLTDGEVAADPLTQTSLTTAAVDGERKALRLRQLRTDHERDPEVAGRYRALMARHGRLRHPAIVPSFGPADANALCWVLGAPGEVSLAQLMGRDSRLDPLVCVQIAWQVLLALSEGHALGLVHRDVRPEQVWITKQGDVVLGEFGVWGIVEPQPRARLRFDANLLAYDAPEAVEQKPGDARADLFSVGVLLYELLGGGHPFRGSSAMDTSLAIAAACCPPLVRVRSAVSEDLSQVVGLLMARDPEGRFQSALAAANALRAVESRRVSQATMAMLAAPPVARGKTSRTLISFAALKGASFRGPKASAVAAQPLSVAARPALQEPPPTAEWPPAASTAPASSWPAPGAPGASTSLGSGPPAVVMPPLAASLPPEVAPVSPCSRATRVAAESGAWPPSVAAPAPVGPSPPAIFPVPGSGGLGPGLLASPPPATGPLLSSSTAAVGIASEESPAAEWSSSPAPSAETTSSSAGLGPMSGASRLAASAPLPSAEPAAVSEPPLLRQPLAAPAAPAGAAASTWPAPAGEPASSRIRTDPFAPVASAAPGGDESLGRADGRGGTDSVGGAGRHAAAMVSDGHTVLDLKALGQAVDPSGAWPPSPGARAESPQVPGAGKSGLYMGPAAAFDGHAGACGSQSAGGMSQRGGASAAQRAGGMPPLLHPPGAEGGVGGAPSFSAAGPSFTPTPGRGNAPFQLPSLSTSRPPAPAAPVSTVAADAAGFDLKPGAARWARTRMTIFQALRPTSQARQVDPRRGNPVRLVLGVVFISAAVVVAVGLLVRLWG